MAKERKKRKRKTKPSGTSGGGAPSGGGGLLQGIRSGIQRAAGTHAEPAKPASKWSNIITTALLVAAMAFLLYRWLG